MIDLVVSLHQWLKGDEFQGDEWWCRKKMKMKVPVKMWFYRA